MNRILERLPIVVIGALLVVVIAWLIQDQWAIHHLPAPVLAAVGARFPGAYKSHVETRVEQGLPVYELSLRQRGEGFVVRVTLEGEILQISRHINNKELPLAVRGRLKSQYPEGRILGALAVHDEAKGSDHYRVQLALTNGDVREVACDPEGRVGNASPRGEGGNQ